MATGFPLHKSGAGGGGNAPGPASQTSAAQQAAPSAGTAPQQLGGGQPAARGGGAPQAGGGQYGQLLGQAFGALVQEGFTEENLATTEDFFRAIQEATQAQAPQGAQPAAGPTV